MTRSTFGRRARALLAAGFGAAAVAACSTFLGPDDEFGTEVSFDTSPNSGQDLPDAAGIGVEGKRIQIVGAITTGDPCREVRGAGTVTGNRIQITIRAESVGEGCIAVLGRFDYQATVSGVKSGPWIVEVRHLFYGHGDPGIVATRAVVVP